jgi:hypothetical protein
MASKGKLRTFFCIKERASAQWCATICSCCAVLLYAAHPSCAQTTQSPGSLPVDSCAPVATTQSYLAKKRSATPPRETVGSSGENSARKLIAADAAKQPATVSFSNGKPIVEANNSDFAQILQNLSGVSGMTISGFNGGPRVFGIYGPGSLTDVLVALLISTGRNYIIAGGATDGTPRELLLNAKKRCCAIGTARCMSRSLH